MIINNAFLKNLKSQKQKLCVDAEKLISDYDSLAQSEARNTTRQRQLLSTNLAL